MKYIIVLLALFANSVQAHEMTPTYFEFKPSYLEGISSVNLRFFNRRADIKYYEFNVYDKDWNPIPFATKERLLKISYLGQADIEIYVKNDDLRFITYICSESKILKEDVGSTSVSSKICSKNEMR